MKQTLLLLLASPAWAVRGWTAPASQGGGPVANGATPVTRQLIAATYEGLRGGGPGGDAEQSAAQLACFVVRESLEYARVGRDAPPEVKVKAGVEVCVQLEAQSVALQTLLRGLARGTLVKAGWDYEGPEAQRRVTLLVAEGKRTPVDHQSIFAEYLGPATNDTLALVSFSVKKSLEYKVYGTQPKATVEAGLRYTLQPRNMSSKFQATLKSLNVGAPATLTWDDYFVENERYENGRVVRETKHEHTAELFPVVTLVKRELLAVQVATATYTGVKEITAAGISDEKESSDENESTAAGVSDEEAGMVVGGSDKREGVAAGVPEEKEFCFDITASLGFVEASQRAEAEVMPGQQFCSLQGVSSPKINRTLSFLSINASVTLGWARTMVTYEERPGDGSKRTYSKLEHPVILIRQGAEVNRTHETLRKVTATYVGHIRQTETGEVDDSQHCFEVDSTHVPAKAHRFECFAIKEQSARVQVTLASLQEGTWVKLSWWEDSVTIQRKMGNVSTVQLVEQERVVLVLEP